MKLQKLTEKRWFWPALCAVSVVFGWWYLSITTCAPLGGDDELINLQNYYYITHTSFGRVCWITSAICGCSSRCRTGGSGRSPRRRCAG